MAHWNSTFLPDQTSSMDGNQSVIDNHESLSKTANSDYRDQYSSAVPFVFLPLAIIIQTV